MLASSSISLQFNVRPEAQDAATPQQVSGLQAAEGFGLEIPAASAFFHRVCLPENVEYDSSGSMGTADSHYLGEFPDFANLGSGSAVPVQDWDGQPLSLSTLKQIAIRIDRRVRYTGVKASGVLTSTNTAPANNSTVVIGSKTYTFKTALSPAEGQVLIAGSADAALLNLIRAINHTGTPGTDYSAAAVHPQVTADASVTAHTITVRAREYGVAGNAIAVTASDLSLAWSAATLADGAEISDPPELRPLEGKVTVTLSNDMLPGTGSAANFSTTSPGIFYIGTEDGWTPGATGEIIISYETDQPSPATDEDINAIATVILLGAP